MSLNLKAKTVAELLRLSVMEKLDLAEWLRTEARKQLAEDGSEDHPAERYAIVGELKQLKKTDPEEFHKRAIELDHLWEDDPEKYREIVKGQEMNPRDEYKLVLSELDLHKVAYKTAQSAAFEQFHKLEKARYLYESLQRRADELEILTGDY